MHNIRLDSLKSDRSPSLHPYKCAIAHVGEQCGRQARVMYSDVESQFSIRRSVGESEERSVIEEDLRRVV
jgi:hypothetical protein